MTIMSYKGNVYTHAGQSNVRGFRHELAAVQIELKAIGGLKVYLGVHGTSDGFFDRNFDKEDNENAAQILTTFKNAKAIWLKNGILDASDIYQIVKVGSVLFTWCDSDKRVKQVMGSAMPEKA